MIYALQKILRLRTDESGSTAVEFALISTVFLAFIVGIYACGIYFLTWNRLQYGTEEATRYASIHDGATAGEIEEIVFESMSVLSIERSNLTVSVDYLSSNGVSFAEVSSSYQFELTLPFLPVEMSDLRLDAVSRMAIN